MQLLQGLEGVQRYFAMARGFEDKLAMDMSKFFDTNYHYLVCGSCDHLLVEIVCCPMLNQLHTIKEHSI